VVQIVNLLQVYFSKFLFLPNYVVQIVNLLRFFCRPLLAIVKTRFESGPVKANLTTTVVHSNKLLINDVKPVHSLFV